MKTFIIAITFFSISVLNSQNPMLSGSQTGNPLSGAAMYDIEFAYDGTNLALLVASYTTGKIYAIDYNSSSASGVHDWNTNNVPNIVASIASIVGTTANNLEISEMEVNPKTKSVFLLMHNISLNTNFLVEVKSVSDIAVVSFIGVTYAAINYTTNNNYIYDMEWGANNKLYYCTGDFTLDAEVAAISIPFVHNFTPVITGTSVFKSNWGGSYFTTAPLEKISFTNVDGIDRLMGVTTCSPGFSIPVIDIDNPSPVLQVTEDFDVVYNYSVKVVAVTQLGTSYLFDLHLDGSSNQLIRIGEKYIDGSRAGLGEINNNAQEIRTTSGIITPALNMEEAKEISVGYKMMAKYSDYALMVVDENDVLRLHDVTSESLGTQPIAIPTKEILIYPSPANERIYFSEPDINFENNEYIITDMDGKCIISGRLVTDNISVSNFENGVYILTILGSDNGKYTGKFIKK